MTKSKIAVAITIGIMSFMMIYVMLIQISIASDDDREEVEFLRETELKELLTSYKARYEETNEKIVEAKEKIDEYKKDEKTEEDAIELLEEEVKQAKMLLGYTDVVGEGIVVTMENNIIYDEGESAIVSASDIIELVNELKLAGAEAISVNDERIISRTDIFDVAAPFIHVNGQRKTSPFVIKAIGDIKYLESALKIKGGFLDSFTLRNFKIGIETKEDLKINKYEGELTLKYVKKEEGNK